MEKGVIIPLILLGIIFFMSINLTIATCPEGQMSNFDGSCIPDPNYKAGAVSCESLMASTGRTAETICSQGGGQCCNKAVKETQDNSENLEETDSNFNNDFVLKDCSTDDDIIPGRCEVLNQYNDILYNQLDDRVFGSSDDSQAWQFYLAEQQAEIDYEEKVVIPKETENTAIFNNCIDGDTDSNICYDNWERVFFEINLNRAKYELELVKKLQQDVNALPSSGKNDEENDGLIDNGGSVSQGDFNTNSNRGRDESGRMMPSFDGYYGYAYVERADGTKVIPGHELYLKINDVLSTGDKSSISVRFSDAGNIDLGPNTAVKVGNALLDQYYLARGTLKSKIKLAKLQKFEIDTPGAMFTIRGTEFIINYNETTNITTVYLNEGVLEINIKNKIMNLTAGNYMVIYPDGKTVLNAMGKEWNSFDDVFYKKSMAYIYFLLVFIIIDIVVMIILCVWMNKKIKNINKKDKSNSKGVASLVLGIIGIILFFAPYIGIILSSLAFSFSRVQKANNPTKSATAGFILGMIGIVINALVLLSVFLSAS